MMCCHIMLVQVVRNRLVHRAEFCDISGTFTSAMALNLKDQDDNCHDTIKKNGQNRQRSCYVLFCHSSTI